MCHSCQLWALYYQIKVQDSSFPMTAAKLQRRIGKLAGVTQLIKNASVSRFRHMRYGTDTQPRCMKQELITRRLKSCLVMRSFRRQWTSTRIFLTTHSKMQLQKWMLLFDGSDTENTQFHVLSLIFNGFLRLRIPPTPPKQRNCGNISSCNFSMFSLSKMFVLFSFIVITESFCPNRK